MRKIGDILETIVVVAILLVLVHTFLDDCSIIAGWAVASRKWIVWTGLAFDLFFTIEFFTRLYIALVNGEGAEYFLRQRGWIDFLASIPLLLLNSLPSAVALLAGAGLVSGAGSFLNVLKVIKAVRIARILRLLRVIKLFRSIRYAQSPMAQRHLSTIITVGVTILVFWSFGSAALERLGILPGLETTYLQGQTLRARSITEGGPKGAALSERAAAVAALDSTVLAVREPGARTAWSRHDPAYYAAHFIPGDYGYFSAQGIEVFLDERPYARALAREALVSFIAVVLTVLGYLFIYAPLFALDITDPINVMRRGMAERGYTLEVKIPPGRSQDDVYELAGLYNSVYLPLKDREGAGAEGQGTALKIDDIKGLVEKA